MKTDDELDLEVRRRLEQRRWPVEVLDPTAIAERAHRRRRRWRARAGALLVAIPVLAVGTALALGERPSDHPDPASREGPTMRTTRPVTLNCGDRVIDSSLLGTRSLDARALRVPASGPGLVAYEVTLTNETDTPLNGLLAPVESVVTRDGIVVTTVVGGRQVGTTVSLDAGAEQTLTATLSIVDCQRLAEPSPAPDKQPQQLPSGSLSKGTYTAYSWTTMTLPDGNGERLYSGPWELTLR